ncbi:TPA: lytic transglycosylase domain-containing protein [Serratia fonticola]
MKVTANGKTFEFPDGTSTDDVGAAIDEYFGGQAQQVADPAPEQAQGGMIGNLYNEANNAVNGLGRSMMGAAVNVANIPAELWDFAKDQALRQVASSGVPMKSDTLPSAPRVTTGAIEKSIGAGEGSLTPQGTIENVVAQAIPYLIPGVGQDRLAAQAPGLASRAVEFAANSVGRNAVGASAQTAGGDGSLAGNLAAGVAGEGVLAGAGNAIGAAYRGLKGTIAPEVQKAIQFADSQNLPLMTTDVSPPGGFTGESARALGEKIPIAGTGASRRAQQNARSQLVQDYADRFGEVRPDEIVQSLRRQTNKVKQAAGNRLSDIQNQMSSVGSVTPTSALNALDSEIANLSKLGKVADTQTISKLQAYRDELSGAADFNQLRNLRTQFRQDVKGERAVWPTRSEASVNRVYSALTGDLDNAVSKNLGAATANKYRQANAAYANEAKMVNGTRLKNVLQKGDLTPEVVNNLLFSKKPSEVRQLYASLDGKGRSAARAAVIGKAYEKSGGSPDKFLNEVNRLGSQTGILFKGADQQYLKGLTSYLDYTRRAARAGAVTPTGQEIIQFGAPTAVVTDLLTNGGLGTAAFATYGSLARVYESKVVRNSMLKLANTPRGSSAFERNVQEVMRHVNAMAQGARGESTK